MSVPSSSHGNYFKPGLFWDEALYLFGDAAAASGVSPNLLKAWLRRQVVPLGRYDLKGQGKGSSSQFTLRTIFSITLLAEMVRLGLSPSRAARIAKTTTDRDDFSTESGLLATGAESVLVVFPRTLELEGPDGDDGFGHIASGADLNIHQFINKRIPGREGPNGSFAVISLGAVFDRIKQVLNCRVQFSKVSPDDAAPIRIVRWSHRVKGAPR